jgi:hypothetical protein
MLTEENCNYTYFCPATGHSMKPNRNAEAEDLCINYRRRSSKFLPTPAAGVGTEKWQKNCIKIV